MIDPHDFSKMQFDLTAEFGKYIFDHPEVDDMLPDGAFIYFEVEGEPEFNQYSRELAEKQRRQEKVPVVIVRVKGLAPAQGSRLLDPIIEPMPAVA
jgi:hypothetical protein